MDWGQAGRDQGFAAGAAAALLDGVARRQKKWAGVWRQRLALSAAVAGVKRAGRGEDEAALRDVWCLRPPGLGLLVDGSTALGPAGSFSGLASAFHPAGGGAAVDGQPGIAILSAK